MILPRLSPFILFCFLLVFGMRAAWSENVMPSSQDGPQHVVHILAYVANDYGGAVRDGQVLSQSEYDEQLEFVRRAQQLLDGLKDPSLQQQMQVLVQAVESKAEPREIKAQTTQLRARLIKEFHLETAPQQAPVLASGALLFQQNCAVCHGAQGRGDGPQGAHLDPKPANFHERGRMDQISPFGFYNTIHFGVSGTGMPAFGHLSDQEIWNLAFYVSSLRYTPADIKAGQGAFERDPVTWLDRFGGLAGLAGKSDQDLLQQAKSPNAPLVLAYLRTHPNALRGGSSSLALVRSRLAASWKAYEAGNQAQAYSLAVSAYLDGFESVEPAINAVKPTLRTQVEEQMSGFRNAIRSHEPPAQVHALYRGLLPSLDQVEVLLSRKGLSPATSFVSAFVILLREGLEAVLVVAAIVSILIRAKRQDALRYIHVGWISAVLLGGATWWAAKDLIAITGASREVIEGVSAMFAVLILFFVSYWLLKNLEMERWKRFLHEKIQHAASGGSLWTLAALTFIAVYREIFETVLFYEALWAQAGASGQNAVLVGLASAGVVLAGMVWAIFKLGIRLPLRPFFAVSSGVLYLLAFMFAGKGVLALQEAGWLPTTPVSFVRIDLLGIYPSMEGLALQGALILAMLGALLYTFAPRMKVAHS